MELSQPILIVRRFRDCVRFYRDLLGCELERGGEDGPVAFFRSGGQRFGLLDHAARPPEVVRPDEPEPGPPRVTLAFHSDDIDGEYKRLSEAGVVYTLEPRDFPDWGYRSSLCLDPDGNPVEIACPLEGGR